MVHSYAHLGILNPLFVLPTTSMQSYNLHKQEVILIQRQWLAPVLYYAAHLPCMSVWVSLYNTLAYFCGGGGECDVVHWLFMCVTTFFHVTAHLRHASVHDMYICIFDVLTQIACMCLHRVSLDLHKHTTYKVGIEICLQRKRLTLYFWCMHLNLCTCTFDVQETSVFDLLEVASQLPPV